MPVKFQDFSIQVKAAINDTTIGWLHTWSNEIASHAKDNCQMTDDNGQLRKSYTYKADEGRGESKIGSRLESAYWEEWGTGEYAAHGDGRKGWWIYIPGQESMGGGRKYNSREEAEDMAAYIRAKYGKPAVVTNGRRPNYTLEKAFTVNAPKAKQDLAEMLKEGVGN